MDYGKRRVRLTSALSERLADWLDWFSVTDAASYVDGNGALNMTLYAMRCPLNFRYFRGNDSLHAS
jgi:hypothetical protein